MRIHKLPPYLMLDGPDNVTGTSTPPAQAAAPAAVPATPAQPAAPAATDPAPASPAVPPVPAPPAGAQPPAPATPAEPQDVASLPDWAQKELRDTRKEAQGLRQTRDAQIANARTQAQTDLAQQIGRAIGLVPEETPTDPQELIAAANARSAAAQAAQKAADIRLAVYQAAPDKTTADLLLDSRTFDTAVQALDPTAADFAAQVAAQVQATVTANPTRYAPTPAVAPANTGGAPVTGAPAGGGDTIEDFRKTYRESRGLS